MKVPLEMEKDTLATAKLWLVLDEQACQPRSMLQVTLDGLAGGVGAVVLRMKDAPDRQVIATGMPIAEACRDAAVGFVVSHALNPAQVLNADAFHTGISGPSIEEARSTLPQSMAIGFSAHGVGEAQHALEGGADYCFLGPIYPSPKKLPIGDPLGIGVIPSAVSTLGNRFVCIGGIDCHNLQSLIAQGATRIAVIRAICSSQDPARSASRLRQMLDQPLTS